MRAARFYDRGDIRVEEINEPAVKTGQVGIDVAGAEYEPLSVDVNLSNT